MYNPYVVRTATLASLAAALVATGWMGMQGDDAQMAPEQLAVSSPPALYFPASYELQPNPDEREIFEYY
jgi:hypothetical protein